MKTEYILDLVGLALSDVAKEINRYGKVLRKLIDGVKTHSKRREQLLKIRSQLQFQRSFLDQTIAQIDDTLKMDKVDAESYARAYENVYMFLTEQTAKNYLVFLSTIITTAEQQKINLNQRDVQIYYSYTIKESLSTFLKAKETETYHNTLKLQLKHFFTSDYTDNECMLCSLQRLYLMDFSDSIYKQLRNININYQKNEKPATEAFKSLLALYLCQWREENGYTKKALSEQCGIERTTISNLESMRQLASTDKIITLLQATGAQLVIVPSAKVCSPEKQKK